MANHIIEELHRFREEYAKKFDYDSKAILADIKQQEREGNHTFVKLPLEDTAPTRDAPKL